MNGRTKGAVNERAVAKKIEGWWQDLEPGAEFYRTPLSGGWASPTARAGFKTSGDLVTTAKRFPFAVEVKAREGWSYTTFFAGKPCPVWGWWLQAQDQAREQGAEPMLWVRHNREPWVVLVREGYVHGLSGKAREQLRLWCKQQGWGQWPDKRGAAPVAYYAKELLCLSPVHFAMPPSRKG